MSKRINVQAHSSQLELGTFDSQLLLSLFPFALILDRDMIITSAGEKIIETWIVQNPSKPPHLFLGSCVIDLFKLRRPKGITFKWDTIIQMNLVFFELELIRSDMEDDEGPKVIESVIGPMAQCSFGASSKIVTEQAYAAEAAQTGKT